MQKVRNVIGYNYIAIKITQSRINKGLLSIPISLLDRFPKEKLKISIFFDDEEKSSMKGFIPYTSSSKECRINGLSSWFAKNKIQDQDEIVVQFLDEDNGIYRIIKEDKFIEQVRLLENKIDNSKKENDLEQCFEDLALKVNQPKMEVAIVEFLRLNNEIMKRRAHKKPSSSLIKENVPASLRKILELIYQGRCQISNFTFIQRNGKPYFEIHHIKPDYGNHFKNLLVVSPNIHAMFTHACYVEYFDNDGWLRKVKFNDEEFNVYQAIDNFRDKYFVKDVHL